ncbi:MAG: flavin reductase family protein, partial [Gaiellaceae bacterium]
GVAIVTSRADAGPRGCTTNAFSSLSLDPPLVLVCLDRGSNTLAAIRGCGRFVVNVLASGQEELARRFATKHTGEEKFAGVESEDAAGLPVLAGALAWVACELEAELPGGDHVIVTGRPVASGQDLDVAPLLFFRGGFGF